MAKSNIGRFGTLEYWTEETATFRTRVVRGLLGAPVGGARVQSQLAAVSSGTGDDAGHLIARRFGGPDLPWNLGRQNWIQNRGQGTWYAAEMRWADVLKNGGTVYVTVSERTRLEQSGASGDSEKFGDRALYRQVTWTIRSKDGKVEEGELSFLNSDSAKVRAAQGIAPQNSYEDNVYSLFTGQKL